MSPTVAAIDQGTTGTRCMIFDQSGRAIAAEYAEHRQIYPQPGWVEHDAEEIWANAQRVVAGALAQAPVHPAEIVGVGVTNQRETALIWDKTTGRPLYHAIVWQCTRTLPICQQLIDDGLEATFRARAGLPVATYFSGPKIKWLIDHVPQVRQKVESGQALFGNMDTWIVWNLTGGVRGGAHVTDPTNASRTMLMNLQTLDWDDGLLGILGIPRAMLPAIRPSSDRQFYGHTRPEGPFGRAIPVCGDLGDQQAALFGQTCYGIGEAKNTYGTGCFMLLNTGTQPVPSQSGLLTTVAYSLQPGQATYALEGSVAITGAAVQWLRDNLGLIKNAAETEAIAASVEDAGGCYFVPAFSGLFAPYWDMYARGVIVGLTRYVNKAHIVRATLEAIGYQTRDVMEAMLSDVKRPTDTECPHDSGLELTQLKVDGGAVVNNLLMQLQADILGVPVVRPTVNETTALGAAYAAGLATGLWSSLDDLKANWGVDRTFTPAWSEERRAEGYRGWKKAVARTREWIEK